MNQLYYGDNLDILRQHAQDASVEPMIVEAASAGFYTSPHQGKFPKIQILTIAGLLAGHERPSYPDLSLGAATFKKAALERGDGGQGELFP